MILMSKNTNNYLRFIFNIKQLMEKYKIHTNYLKYNPNTCYYTATVDFVDVFFNESLRNKITINTFAVKDCSKRYFMEHDTSTSIDVSKLSDKELDQTLLQLLSKNKHSEIIQVITECTNTHRFMNITTIKKIFRNYSLIGRTDVVALLQKYCAKVDPNLHKRNGEFSHYLAKAQCLKGNAEKGLSILKDSYKKNQGLRSFYRVIFKELIQDSVLNRSEATLIIFKKYVLEFSDTWGDHYPLICFWHICWSSTWFSDQMLSNELLESSQILQGIIRDKSRAFSFCILKEENNEDAVVRLLQVLLKYKMMTEYVKVLQVLFSYKLRNKDIRGCSEIIKHCKLLGINLPSDQQGRYIEMLIEGPEPTARVKPKNFKLKF